jgi:hypothetical protein
MSNAGKDLPPGPYVPTAKQRVPQPPRDISPQERIKFYQEDLGHAFGEEFIDSTPYQPPVLPARTSTPGEDAWRTAKRRKGDPAFEAPRLPFGCTSSTP